MSIPIQRYINIHSGVGAGAGASTRKLIGRFVTTNPLLPTNSYAEFSNLADVGTYFGTGSTEYLRASFYFGWTSKNSTSPGTISFVRWASAAVGSTIYGVVANYTLSSFTSITTGDFTLTLGGFTQHLTSINLSAAGSLTAVAAAIQTKINAFSAGGVAWTGATVSYDATRQQFDFVSGANGADIITVAAGVTTDVAGPLGWLTGAILSNGSAIQTITSMLDSSTNTSNNFGSFAFIPALNLAQVTEAANWNLAQNNQFMYCVPVTVSNAASWNAALKNIGGTTLILAPLTTEYPEQEPMMLLAATDYTRRKSVYNYMFNVFNLTPSVLTNTDANTYDALNINYYGQTQQAGQNISFYQRGVMFGLPTDPGDQNTYANEIWLKDAIGAALMTLLLVLTEVAANAQGRSQILTTIQTIINQAIFNGSISVGKPLTEEQILYITNATGDVNAWQQVQNAGYVVDVQIVPYIENTIQKYKAVYTLIYSKDDVIRLIEGTNTLI